MTPIQDVTAETARENASPENEAWQLLGSVSEAVEEAMEYGSSMDGVAIKASEAHEIITDLVREANQSAATISRLRFLVKEAAEVTEPFAKVATERYPGKKHTSPLYGLERQTGTGELRLYSPFSDSRSELEMWSADFVAAASLHEKLRSEDHG